MGSNLIGALHISIMECYSLARHPRFSNYMNYCLEKFAEFGELSDKTKGLGSYEDWIWFRSAHGGEAGGWVYYSVYIYIYMILEPIVY